MLNGSRTGSRSKPASAAIALAALLSGCGAGNLPDYIKLGDLRILAVKANTPEVLPGATVSVELVVSDLALNRSLTYSAVGCVDPGIGYGAKASCTGSSSLQTIAPEAAIPATQSVPSHTALVAAPSFTIPSDILANRNPVDQFNGVAYLAIYTLSAANADGSKTQVTAYKRIIVSSALHTPKNSNPDLTGVSAGSQALGSLVSSLSFPYSGTSPIPLTPSFGTGSLGAESYSLLGTDGTPRALQETLTTTWFISDGSMEFYRTTGADPDSWTPPAEQPKNAAGSARGVFFVVVTRDGRGGEDFDIFQ
jgi:hypothetical protein